MRKSIPTFCHSERSEESLFLFRGPKEGEIPRFARNDKITARNDDTGYIFRRLKPAPRVMHQNMSKVQ
jgi:hypothetical protein